MGFIQTIELLSADGGTLAEHLASWHAEQHGVAPGYEGYRLLANRDQPGRFLILVDFSSVGEANANNARPETAAWAAKLTELATVPASFANFDDFASSSH